MATGSNISHLSRGDALHFITGVLYIDKPEDRFSTDKLQLLSDLAREFQYRIPFQSVTQNSQSKSERKAPSVEESIRFVLAGHGGLCWTQNVFMHELLMALEYDVSLVLSTVFGIHWQPDNHVHLILTGVVEPGDHYLMDVGLGWPCFRAICLDFEQEEESPNFSESFLTYKYIKQGDEFSRLHLRKPNTAIRYPTLQEGTQGRWERVYTSKLTAITLERAEDMMNKSMYARLDTVFNISLRAVKIPHGRAVVIKDKVLLLENEQGTVVPTNLESHEEVLGALQKYFPELPLDTCKAALDNLKLFD